LSEHPELEAPIIAFSSLPESTDWWCADAVICTLGTTMRVAGSQNAFRNVDMDYPLKVAKLARQHGAPAFVLTPLMSRPVVAVPLHKSKARGEREL
jgi:uncharacterized protein YbjT (DUF2867 family)